MCGDGEEGTGYVRGCEVGGSVWVEKFDGVVIGTCGCTLAVVVVMLVFACVDA
jgi:hypothetical protein